MNSNNMLPDVPTIAGIEMVAGDAPAAWVHPRRAGEVQVVDDESGANKMWVVHQRNKENLEQHFLPHVKAKLVALAAELGLRLDENDVKWLEDHKGHFEFYCHPNSNAAKVKIEQWRARFDPRCVERHPPCRACFEFRLLFCELQHCLIERFGVFRFNDNAEPGFAAQVIAFNPNGFPCC